MNFIVRPAQDSDISSLLSLAKQFSLLNLPADKKKIQEKLMLSKNSFAGKLPSEHSEYLFVTEDLSTGNIAGSSQIKAKHGTPENPTYSFEVLKKDRFSRDLGIGFIHQVLRLKVNTDGPTELGGLVVDKSYRRRPEQVGSLSSLLRFLFVGMHPERFQKELHAEMAPPLTDEGRSEFWEALGRRFTGMPYQEADAISQENKEFIRSLFPEEDIYLCLLDSKARLVLGRVGPETQGALKMLEKMGFKYKNEVDPFDGGPHVGVLTSEVTLLKKAKTFKIAEDKNVPFSGRVYLASEKSGMFLSGQSAFALEGEEIILPPKTLQVLQLKPGDTVYGSI